MKKVRQKYTVTDMSATGGDNSGFPKRPPKVLPQHIKEKFVENEELSHGGRWIGKLADQHNERLLKEWPGLLNMSADEFEAIAQDLEAQRP